LGPELARTFVSLSSDIALVIDPDGVIRDVAVGRDPVAAGTSDWVGRPWVDTVTSETRLKIQQLLDEASTNGVSRRREVNHPSSTGLDVPVAYAAVRLGQGGPVLAVGRDLRAIAAIQQKFTETQGEMERDYWRRRQGESRYRTLFQVATDAVLVVDAQTLRVVEANQAAAQLFDLSIEQLVGKNATIGIDRTSRPAVEELLTTARASGRPVEMRARLVGKRGTTSVAATPFRADDTMMLLVRASALQAADGSVEGTQALSGFVEHMPDGVVVTDSGGRILLANRAFLTLTQVGDESVAKGQSLAQWFGGERGPLAAILAHARRHGMAPPERAEVTSVRGDRHNVRVSAVLLPEGDQECIGFTITPAPEAQPADGAEASLAVALEHLTGQLGLTALPGLMQAAERAAERHFIAAALIRAGGDPDYAAALLQVDITTLERRMQHLGLSGNEGSAGPPSRLN
jgi:transcriptional regulator PpsR